MHVLLHHKFGSTHFIFYIPSLKLLSGQKKNAPFWSFDYYQKFFDVDTYQVVKVISYSM
jgi:restriction endonuclease